MVSNPSTLRADSVSSLTSAHPQRNANGNNPLPATYLFHYAQRLRSLVTVTLTKTHAPAQVVPFALLLVQRLVSLRTLPPLLSTPTRLLLAALILADAVLRDATLPTAAWLAVARSVGGIAGVADRKAVADLKMGCLAALDWNVVVPDSEFEAWLERLKGWVAGAAAAAAAAPPSSTASSVATLAGSGVSFGAGSTASPAFVKAVPGPVVGMVVPPHPIRVASAGPTQGFDLSNGKMLNGGAPMLLVHHVPTTGVAYAVGGAPHRFLSTNVGGAVYAAPFVQQQQQQQHHGLMQQTSAIRFDIPVVSVVGCDG
ncbi:hypothetical protein HDU67_006951 [Dinochytrium kinnereticum]|nr:hypothetical protein HDU67_006951 [Dinochytrium kinnereticum]